MRKLQIVAATIVSIVAASASSAAGFINGSFENGTASGWVQGGGYRGGTLNPLNPADFLPGGSLNTDAGTRSAVIDTSYVDPNLGAALGSTVYSGNYAFRADDTVNGGYASVISQTVKNYTDHDIFFAWKAVLENGGHPADESATMVITLRDLTTHSDLIRREYNAEASGGGVDKRFSSSGDLFYTANWQIEQLSINSSLAGHDFQLTVLGADCEPTGHTGYVYLDGFGAVTPPAGAVPEPATWAMMVGGFGMVGGAIRRRRTRFAIA